MKLLTATGPIFQMILLQIKKRAKRQDAEEDQVEVGSWLPEA